MLEIDGNKISLTRGNSAQFTVDMFDSADNPYTPQAGDTVTFSLKRHKNDDDALIEKQIPTNTLELELLPSDTENLAYGSYFYFVTLKTLGGDVDTFISKGMFFLSEEG